MKNQILLFMLVVSFQAPVNAQNPPTVQMQKYGTLVLTTMPPIGSTIAKVGDTILQQGNKVKLLPGEYEVTLWSRYYEPITRTVTILADSLHYLKENLVLSEETKSFRELRSAYNTKVFTHTIAPYTSTTLLAFGSVVAYMRALKFQKKALDWKDNYEVAGTISNLIFAKGQYENARKSSVNNKRTMYVLSGLTVGSGYLAWRGRRKLAKLDKPVLPRQVPPFQVEGFGATFNDDNRPVFCLTLKF